ncbi:HSP20 family protein [Halomicrobium zhouii]|uniref:HSP20 family protein n=1 Tax=Halomicrobium zhouii TaxID=767519 RepID=A0A1I6M900_9EURY|nr:Hsp20/alpha crystallin family protein [Halomicrobium zhouii]SFS12127.1 HSP20 family protein [Halomicrobium zhouii]
MATDPLDEIERVFGLLSQQFGTELAGVPTDLIDEGDAYVVRADLPGYRPDDVDVSLPDARTLRITASRSGDQAEGRYVRRERRQHTAERTVSLPEPVVGADARANYDAGVLTVRLAKPRDDGDDDETDIPVN